jgi:glutaredoxin
MNKNKTRITALVIIVALIAAIALIISIRQPNETNSDSSDENIILFYSFSCPHCKNVSDYISENNIKNKYSFTELEISENQKNSAKLIKKAKECGYDTKNLGVPFLWTEGTCLMGDKEIIDFFKP